MRLDGACLGRCPDCKAKGNLVHEIGKVVNQVKNAVLDTAHQISEEIAERVDGSADCHDEAHGLEGGLHVLVHTITPGGNGTSFAHEDFIKNVKPSGHTEHKAHGGIDSLRLAGITEGQHRNCAKQQAPVRLGFTARRIT
jgi:hypothetical protein